MGFCGLVYGCACAATLAGWTASLAHAREGLSERIVLAQASTAGSARRGVIAGIKSFEGRSYQTAVGQLTSALSGTGLTTKDTAKALYYRGRSYRALKKYPEAIADLTSALWLKDGLSASERSVAENDRAAAYAGVGVAKPASVARASGASPSAASPSAEAPAQPKPQATASKPAPTAVARASTPAAPVSFGAPSINRVAPAAPKPSAAAAPVTPPAQKAEAAPQTVPSSWQTSVGATSAAATPAQPAAAPTITPLAQVGSFFSNMTKALTGGGSPAQATALPSAPSATASTGSSTAVSGWNSGTSATAATQPAARAPVSPPAAQRTAAIAAPRATAAPVAKSKPATASPSSGRFNLQLAAVRSRNEAERLARDLAAKHGATLGSRRPQIDEAVYGNMGTFYRVQVGPFANASEPQKLCGKLKSSGFDCLITTR